MLLALFGLTAGQAVVWYTGQFYALFFLTQQLKVDAVTANLMIAGALLLGTPFFMVFGLLSDKIGRKPIIMAGLPARGRDLLPRVQGADRGCQPGPGRRAGQEQGRRCRRPGGMLVPVQPTGTAKFTSSCDVAKQVLAASSVSYDNEVAPAGTPAVIKIGSHTIPSYTSRAPQKRPRPGRRIQEGRGGNAEGRRLSSAKADPAK